MKTIIDIPEYDGDGVDVIWESGSDLSISIVEESVIIKGNNAGLLSLAKQMLYLAVNDLPQGSHVHYDPYDPYFTGIQGCCELILEKSI